MSFETVNPVKHPEIANRYTEGDGKITGRTVVFDNGENCKIIPYEEMFSYNYLTGKNNLFVAEEKFCLAVTALNKESIAKVGFLTGHGEKFEESLKERTENIGAEATEIDIRNAELKGYDVIFIISPKADFTSDELKKLEGFLSDGGTLIAALDADIERHEMFEGFLSEWGITVGRNMVLSDDAGSIMGNQPYSVIGSLKPHRITDALIRNKISPVFFASRSITPLWELHGGIKVSVLAETRGKASAVSLDDESLESGVFSLLTLSEAEKGRIFTFGTSSFFSDGLKAYNGDLLRNIISWSAGGELINEIPPKLIESSAVKVPKKDIVLLIVLFGIIIPAVIAMVGIIVGIRRRRL